MGAVNSVVEAGSDPIFMAGAVGYAVSYYKNEQADLKVGCGAAAPELLAHKSWDAVAYKYVYIHNAFRNDLRRIIASCEKNCFVPSELEQWRGIFDLHERIDKEVVIVALRARLKDSSDVLPQDLVDGTSHDSVTKHIGKVFECGDNAWRVKFLKELMWAIFKHLKKEEQTIMPLLLKHFATEELRAMNSFIVNQCDQETVIKVTKWCFANISIAEGKPLLKNLTTIRKQPPMSLEKWQDLRWLVAVREEHEAAGGIAA